MPVGLELQITSLNGTARGLARLLDEDGKTIHTATGNWFNDQTRRRFAKAGAQKLGKASRADEIEGMLLARLDEIEAERGASPKGTGQAPATPGDFELTDIGNAERVLARQGHNVRYCPRFGRWLAWDGKRWAIDETGVVDRIVKGTFREMKRQAAEDDSPQAVKLFKHAHQSESNRKVRDTIERMTREHGVCVKPEDLDRDPWLLNVENGTIDLRTGKLLRHRREHLVTKVCPVQYDPAATCPLFLAFLDRIFNCNGNLIRFVQRAIGYTLTGLTSERVLFLLYGAGANGKSTLLAVLRELMGDYGAGMPADSLMVRKHNGIPNDIARLKGSRFVSALETEQDRRLAEALVKQMTGGEDVLTARFMRAEFFDFRPEFKLFLATNHKPEIRGTDDGIWDRLRLIPFEVRIPEHERDRTLLDKLKAELAGILAWAVRGCLDWQTEGLKAPVEVSAATECYRDEMDRLGDFIGACCVLGPRCEATGGQLYDVYKAWCSLNGEEPLNSTRFGRQLGEKGYDNTNRDSQGRRLWKGIGIRSSEGSE